MQSSSTIFLLGGSGFIGQALIAAAARQGISVRALARSEQAIRAVAAAGAEPISGDAENPRDWIEATAGCDVLIDLVQPPRSERITRAVIRAISQQRQTFTRNLVAALSTVLPEHRARIISVSGIDDLAPDADGTISDTSALRTEAYGFNPIGIPVRGILERSELATAYAYLGVVYGPGGAFANSIFPSLKAGKWKNFGDAASAMVLVHVGDVARGLLAIAQTPSAESAGRSFVLTDDAPVSMDHFFSLAAQLLDVRAPGHVPTWLAAVVAGKPLVETMLYREGVRSSFSTLNTRLAFPTYRDGLPDALRDIR